MIGPVTYATLRVIESPMKLNPRHERYRPVATRAIPKAMITNSGSKATTAPIPAAGRPASRRHRPEYQRATFWRTLIRASRFAATSACLEYGRRSSAGKSFTDAGGGSATQRPQLQPVVAPQFRHL